MTEDAASPAASPEPIRRPDGRLYRPRKVVIEALTEGDDPLTGVIVFGTHDTQRAQILADEYVRWRLGAGYQAKLAGCGWWRDSFESGCRVWLHDEKHGRAGVLFAEIVGSA